MRSFVRLRFRRMFEFVVQRERQMSASAHIELLALSPPRRWTPTGCEKDEAGSRGRLGSDGRKHTAPHAPASMVVLSWCWRRSAIGSLVGSEESTLIHCGYFRRTLLATLCLLCSRRLFGLLGLALLVTSSSAKSRACGTPFHWRNRTKQRSKTIYGQPAHDQFPVFAFYFAAKNTRAPSRLLFAASSASTANHSRCLPFKTTAPPPLAASCAICHAPF